MTYGLRVINDNNYIQIDSENPRLCAIHKGVYSSGSNTAIINFPTPITTVEPPCIFLQNSPSRPGDLYDIMTVTGSAGNWTGFTLRANNVTWRPTGKWFAAVFASVANSQYGMRLWDNAGKIVYDSGATPVIVTKANHNWIYQGKVQFPGLGAGYYWVNELVAPLASDEYFMMNPFSRGAVGTTPIWANRGVRFDYSSSRLQMYLVTTSPTGPWIDQGQPAALYARLPGS